MRIFFLILLSLLFAHILHSQTPKNKPIDLKLSKEQYHSLTSVSGQLVKHFKLTIDKKIPDEDLLVMVRPVEDISDPDIFISRSYEYPDSFSNSDMICTSNGMDVCTIPSNNITDNSTFFIGIKCYTQCSFALKATYDSEAFFELETNEHDDTLSGTYNLEYDSTNAKIVKFYVPSNNKNYQRILVKVQQVHPQKINESFSIYMNEGNNPPSTSRYHFRGQEAWNSGQCILISDSFANIWASSTFGNFSKSNTNYTLLIEAPQESSIQVGVQAYNELIKVKLHQNLQDMVYLDNKMTYELSIDDNTTASSHFSTNNLLLTLTAFAGNPDLYVNPDTLPAKLTDYKWKSNEDGKESLIITPQERAIAKSSDKKFYITVYGKLTSTFSLWIGTSMTLNYLMFGVAQTGAIANDEIINYRLFIFGDENMNVTATLNTETGNPDLYVKMCILNDTEGDWRHTREERLKCLITSSDIANRYKENPEISSLFLYSDNVGGKDAITFQHDANKCSRTDEVDDNRPFTANKCMYVIGVHGNCNWQNQSQFSLVVTHSQHHIILTEGNPQRNRAELGSTNFYKFSLMDDKNIESLKFYVTEISGKVTTYVSKKNRYPNETNYEKMSYSHWGNLVYDIANVKNISDKTMSGTYYVSIYSETAATYSILVSVKRKTIKPEEQIQKIKLSEGAPQYYSFIYDPTEHHYFTFKTSFSKGELSDVMIHMDAMRGNFKLYIINTKVSSSPEYPTADNYHYMLDSNEHSLLIRNTSLYWTSKAKYVILAQPVESDEGNIKNLYEFILQYSTSQSMKILSSHNPLREAVQNDSYSYYRCEAHKGDESIEISINVHTYNPFYKTMLQVFFSFQSSNPFPNEENNEFNTTVQNNIWILVENSDLTTNCPYLFDDNLNYTKQCVFYMSVRASEVDVPEITYSIATKRNFIVKPENSIMFHYMSDNAAKSVHYNGKQPEPMYFLYKVEKTKRPLHIAAFTQDYYSGSSFTLMANFNPISNVTASSLKGLFPRIEQSAINYVIDSSWHHSVSLTIRNEDFQRLPCINTTGGCGLFITIAMNESFYYPGYYYPSNSTFTIQVTRKLLTLTPSVPFKDFVGENEIKYFRLNIEEEETNILISVTPLNDGDPDLIVNKGLKKDWPDLFSYDYGSKNNNADQIAIHHVKDLINTDNNTYVIGVYGKRNCSFMLTATYGDFQIINIYSASPVAINLKAKEKIYFKYNNFYENEDFRVIFSKEFGEFLFAINTLKENEDFIEKMPEFKKKNYLWSNLESKDLDHLFIQKENKNYCGNCSYIVLVEAEKETSFTLLISDVNQSVYLQHSKTFKDFVKNKGKNKYVTYFYDDVGVIIVDILVYHGDVRAYLYNSSEYNSKNLIETKKGSNNGHIQLRYEPGNNSSRIYFYSMVEVLIEGEGSGSSNFTISIRNEGKDRNIRYGITEYGDCSAFSKYNFTFYSNTNNDTNQYYSVILKPNYNQTYNTSGAFNLSYGILKDTIINIFFNGVSPYGGYYTSRSADYIYVRFIAQKGDFLIQVDNSKNQYGFSFNILLSFSGMDLIYNDLEYVNYLTVGKASYYQLMVENNSKVLVELFQCYGKNRLYVASNQNNILNHQTDLKSEINYPLSSNQIINMYTLKGVSEIYIAVKSIEGGEMDFSGSHNDNSYKVSRYLLKTHFVKYAQTPYEVFYPGNDGKIFFFKENNYLKLIMKRLVCGEKDCKNALTSGLKKSIKYYHYILRINYDVSYLEESVTCFQMNNETQANNFSNSLETHAFYEVVNSAVDPDAELTFLIDLKDYSYYDATPYYAKVVAQVYVEENNGIQPYSFFYKTVEFYPGSNILERDLQGESGSSGLVWILVIVLIALAGALVAAFFFFTKYKKTATQLNYELQDVRNVARMEDNSIKRKDYIGLINESKA